MKLYGLIGYPLGHSFSKSYFTEKFKTEGIIDSRFENFPLEKIEDLKAMLSANPDLQGFNVTIPYKQQIFPYLNDIDSQARVIGAVNCVKVKRVHGVTQLTGHNTDVIGFESSLCDMLLSSRPAALVFGTGGASKAVCYVLQKLGIHYSLVSRRGEGDVLSYSDITSELVGNYKLLINTTPLGTFPNVEEAPDISYDGIGTNHYLFDLVYNPPVTEFLRRGLVRGATVKNGYQMLIAQAEAGYRIMLE